jgi:mevalonate kinase
MQFDNKNEFYGAGKFLISGEYLVLKGAKALAFPLLAGQKLIVSYDKSYSPKLDWVSFDHEGNIWFDVTFELWRFNVVEKKLGSDADIEFLQSILRQVRVQNPHFLREDENVSVKTYLDMPLEWGWGSSSSLLYNISQWAYVSPFELSDKVMLGSGYDIACAQSSGPIVYKRGHQGPSWETVTVSWPFLNNLYLVYLGKKQNTQNQIEAFHKNNLALSGNIIDKISDITLKLVSAKDLAEFMLLLETHEAIVSSVLDKPTLKESRFSDFNGTIKSLGAWGGDFALIASTLNFEEVSDYFEFKGLKDVFRFSQLCSFDSTAPLIIPKKPEIPHVFSSL